MYSWAKYYLNGNRESKKRQQWDFIFVVPRQRHCFIVHVWLPFTVLLIHHTATYQNSLCSTMLRWNSRKKEICQPIQFNSVAMATHGMRITIFYLWVNVNACACVSVSVLCIFDFRGFVSSNWHFHSGSAFYGSIFMLSLSISVEFQVWPRIIYCCFYCWR